MLGKLGQLAFAQMEFLNTELKGLAYGLYFADLHDLFKTVKLRVGNEI